jgi:hypothetical protein
MKLEDGDFGKTHHIILQVNHLCILWLPEAR